MTEFTNTPDEKPHDLPTEQVLRSLRRQINHCESFHRPQADAVVSSGCPDLDNLLPNGGFRMGGVIEWLSGHLGSGVDFWAMNVALQATAVCQVALENHRAIVVIDQERTFYPPAAAALGVDLQRLLIVQPRGQTDVLWAMDQALRCPAVAAVWARVPRLDPRDFRRLQLAAEEGGSLGLLLRPLTTRGQPSWADVRILVEPRPCQIFQSPAKPIAGSGRRRWCIRVLRCRGAKPGATIEVELDAAGKLRTIAARPPTDLPPISTRSSSDSDHGNRRHEKRSHEAGTLHLAAQLAHPTNNRRSARA